MTVRRGFKTEAENRSLQLRRELDLKPYDYLSARTLASYLGITVFAINEIPGLEHSDMELICSDGISALAVVGCTPRVIIYNHRHALTR